MAARERQKIQHTEDRQTQPVLGGVRNEVTEEAPGDLNQARQPFSLLAMQGSGSEGRGMLSVVRDSCHAVRGRAGRREK